MGAKHPFNWSAEAEQGTLGLPAHGISLLPHKKIIEASLIKIKGKALAFKTKFEQTVDMLSDISNAFPCKPILVVTDSWFGNNGLFAPMRKQVGKLTHILSRLRVNFNLFNIPSVPMEGQLEHHKKYEKLDGNARSLAASFKELAKAATPMQ